MGKRRKARESALQILYQLEFDDSQIDETIDRYWRDKRVPGDIKGYSRRLVEGILGHREEIDKAIQSVSEHWRVSRMALIDRNILRLAAFELLQAREIAPPIIIDEAVEIAKRFSGPEAAVFINGILDALMKKAEAGKRPGGEVRHVRKRAKKD